MIYLIHWKVIVIQYLLSNHQDNILVIHWGINKNHNCVKSLSKMGIVPMKKNVNLLMGCINWKKINKLTRSIKQKHAADTFKTGFVPMATDATLFIHQRIHLLFCWENVSQLFWKWFLWESKNLSCYDCYQLKPDILLILIQWIHYSLLNLIVYVWLNFWFNILNEL